MSCNKKMVDPRLLSPTKDLNLDDNQQAETRGINGEMLYQKIPQLNHPSFEETLGGRYASGIRIGRDRLNKASVAHRGNEHTLSYGGGYGGRGTTACSMVDIYAGLASHMTAEGEVSDKPQNPDSRKDAARVYVSAMCDVDDQFNLPAGNIGNIKGKSAVVAKADQLRIHGREGVKIVTGGGGLDTHNSRNCEILSVPYIELMAGNVTKKDMEPIPKGKKLVVALEDIGERINQLAGIVDQFLQAQNKFNNVLMSHTHPDVVAIGLGQCASGNPRALCNGEVLVSMDVLTSGFEMCVNSQLIKKDLLFHRNSVKGTIAKLKEAFCFDQVNSRHVFTN